MISLRLRLHFSARKFLTCLGLHGRRLLLRMAALLGCRAELGDRPEADFGAAPSKEALFCQTGQTFEEIVMIMRRTDNLPNLAPTDGVDGLLGVVGGDQSHKGEAHQESLEGLRHFVGQLNNSDWLDCDSVGQLFFSPPS